MIKAVQELRHRARLIPGTDIRVELNVKGMENKEKLEMIEQFLIQCDSGENPKGEVQHAAN